MDDIITLSIRETGAGNDPDLLNAIRHRLEKAREHKHQLLREYQQHVRTHGC